MMGNGRAWKRAGMIILILSCIVSLLFIGITSASFISSSSGEQSVGIARYAVALGAINPGSLEINCNTDVKYAAYDFWVRNEKDEIISDVSFRYTVKVSVPNGLPEGLTLTIDGIAGAAAPGRTEFTFADNSFQTPAGILTSNSHTLIITADEDVISSNLTIPSISVSIEAEQID